MQDNIYKKNCFLAVGVVAIVHQKYFDLILSNEIRIQDKGLAYQSTLIQQQNLPLAIDTFITRHKEIDTA